MKTNAMLLFGLLCGAADFFARWFSVSYCLVFTTDSQFTKVSNKTHGNYLLIPMKKIVFLL